MGAGRRGTKSRSGCKSCKLSKLKCDEDRPSCGRCHSKGLLCPGYARPLKWSTKHEMHRFSRIQDRTGQSPGQRDSAKVLGEAQPQVGFLTSNFSLQIPDLDCHWNLLPAAEAMSPSASKITDFTQSLFTPAWDENLFDMAFGDPPLDSTSFTPCFATEPTSEHPDSGLAAFDVLPASELDTTPLGTLPTPEKPHALAQSHRKSQNQVLIAGVSPSKGLTDCASVLTEYYFKEVAGLFSCFDGSLNPFRTAVARQWNSSPAMLRAMQSMAAACLTEEYPQFQRMTMKLRADAVALVQSVPELEHQSLLILLMVGQTSSWFDPHDLGITFLATLKQRILRIRQNDSTSPPQRTESITFFQEAVIYWEMLLSFVSNDLDPDTASAHLPNSQFELYRVPHPWTGICRDTQVLVHRVGSLVRQERLRRRQTKFMTQRGLDEAMSKLKLAHELEKQLGSIDNLSESEIVNPGDEETPIWHLQAVSEIYRRTGLLNLYRVFPDLLKTRYELEISPTSPLSEFTISDTTILEKDTFQHNRVDEDAVEKAEQWLASFALDTLQLLESIPVTSRTKCLQPIMLVSIASELRLPIIAEDYLHDQRLPTSSCTRSENTGQITDTVHGWQIETNHNQFSSTFMRVLRARKFVRTRLNLLRHIFPPRPIDTCLELVRQTWAQLDTGDPDVYWIDVMIKHDLGTTMG